jgi:hypothetical protein
MELTIEYKMKTRYRMYGGYCILNNTNDTRSGKIFKIEDQTWNLPILPTADMEAVKVMNSCSMRLRMSSRRQNIIA